jgi:hypothetical protein
LLALILIPPHQRWKTYFSFCQLVVLSEKVSAKRRDLRQNLKDTSDQFEENNNFIFRVQINMCLSARKI